MNDKQIITESPVIADEERARADLYALLARLFYDGPEAALLTAIAQADEMVGGSDGALAQAWRALQAASAAADARAAKQEYVDLFIGVGQAPVSIYASHYLSERSKEHTLVNLRNELARIGLARQAGVVEPEDHLAGLLDVMRHLILRGDAALQESFFRSYLGPWYGAFISTLQTGTNINYYRPVANMLMAFLDIELECFQIA